MTDEWQCTHGHDRCDQMYPGPDCPYCERVSTMTDDKDLVKRWTDACQPPIYPARLFNIGAEMAGHIETLTHITGLAEQEHRRLQTQSDTAEAENTKLREGLSRLIRRCKQSGLEYSDFDLASLEDLLIDRAALSKGDG